MFYRVQTRRRYVRRMDDYSIAIWLWDGVEELDFAGPYEVLTAWARDGERSITVRTVAETTDPVRCSHGLRVIPDVSWADLGPVDLFLLPGGDSRPLQADESFLQRMRELASGGALMTSVCTGALVYGRAGLLADRPATTHWSALERLAALGANVDDQARFVDDGDVVTAAGVSAGIDMALHLVARLESVERAQGIRRYIQYDLQPPV
jgi:transcriptional regulator GlxA family with amidase domain